MKTKDTDRQIQEIWELFREVAERYKETDHQFKETDRKFKETDRKFKETDRKIENLLESIRQSDQKVNKIVGRWGRFVEGLILPAIEKLFAERGIVVDKIFRNVRYHKNGTEGEIDILAIDGEHAVLIEVKSTLGVDDVNEHLERLAQFKTFFPEYADRKVVGAVAGIVIQEDVDRYAYKRGLFVIGESGDTVKILNDRKFQPKIW